MTSPNEPADPVADPNLTYPTTNDGANHEHANHLHADREPDRPTPADASRPTDGTKAKATALIAGATALAAKLRQEAPKRVHELQERRAAGRCVLLTELAGQPVAVGPFRSEHDARVALRDQTAAGHTVDLLTPAAYGAATAAATSTPGTEQPASAGRVP